MGDEPRWVKHQLGALDRRLTVYTEPVAKGRPRCEYRYNRDGKLVPHLITPQKTRAYEETIAWCWKQAFGAERWEGGVFLNLRFYESPRQKEKWQDVDNLTKAVLDALNDVAWVDDRQIVGVGADVRRGVWVGAPGPKVDIVLYYVLPDDMGSFWDKA